MDWLSDAEGENKPLHVWAFEHLTELLGMSQKRQVIPGW